MNEEERKELKRLEAKEWRGTLGLASIQRLKELRASHGIFKKPVVFPKPKRRIF